MNQETALWGGIGAVVRDVRALGYSKPPGTHQKPAIFHASYFGCGLTVNSDTWWFNVRPSNTEPLLRLNLEAATKEECEARTNEVLAIVREG